MTNQVENGGCFQGFLSSAKNATAILIFISTFLSVALFLGTSGIYEGGEGVFASIAREMLETGELLSPKYNGEPYLDYAPATYWLGALSMKLFGVSELALRFFLPISASITVTCLFLITKIFFGTQTGILAAIILASSLLFQFAFRIFLPHSFLIAAQSIAIWGFFVYLSRHNKRNALIFWTGLALTVLIGGISALLPFIGLLIAAFLTGQRKGLQTLFTDPHGIGVFVILGLGWPIYAALSFDGFFVQYLKNQLFFPLFTGIKGINAPFYLYFALLPVALFPWLGVFFTSLARQIEDFFDEPTSLYLLLWLAIPFVILTLSGFKSLMLLTYLMLPATIITADGVKEVFFDSEIEAKRKARWHCMGIAALTAISGIILSYWGFINFNGAQKIGQMAIFGGIFWLFCSLIILAFILKATRRGVVVIIATIVPGLLLFVIPYISGSEPYQNGSYLPSKSQIMKKIHNNLPKDQKVIFVNEPLSAWYFYTGKKPIVYQYPNNNTQLPCPLKHLKSDEMLLLPAKEINNLQTYIGKTLATITYDADWALVQTGVQK
jgi:hypothetical protein